MYIKKLFKCKITTAPPSIKPYKDIDKALEYDFSELDAMLADEGLKDEDIIDIDVNFDNINIDFGI
ncbi:MAG: hypothetical protein AB7E09_08360 [Candidatus Izemoplasmatales bacterium]